MKSFRNLFRSKKDEKDKECNFQCIQRKEFDRLPPAIKSYPKPPPPRLFSDDMNIYNPAAAYHAEIKPAVRRPLRSCPGDVASNHRNRHLSDSDDDDIPFKHERRRTKIPKSHYGDRKTFTTRTKFESKETSEYGSEDHSPISNALKFGGFDNDSYYQKYRKYKNRTIQLYEQNKTFQERICQLEIQLKTSNQQKHELLQQVNSLKRQLQNIHNYNYAQPQYPTYYSHHHQQQFAPPPPHSGFPPLPPPPITYSTAPTIPVESDEVKTFRRQDTDSKPLSTSSISTTSFPNFGSFQPDAVGSRLNSQSIFDAERENLPPSFNNDAF